MPPIVQAVVRDVRIVALGATRPTSAEFDAHIAQAIAWEPSVRCVLVWVESGGSLDARERVALANANLLSKPVAVLVDSALTRSILTAVSWLGGSMAAFAPGELVRACDYLEIPAQTQTELGMRLDALRAELAGALRAQDLNPGTRFPQQ